MLKRFFNYLNPAYHLRQMREDLRLMLQAFKNRKEFAIPHSEEELQQLFRGRLSICFFLSGPFAFVGASIGGVVQYATRNPYLGVAGTILGIFFVTSLTYQFFWWLDNRRIYSLDGRFGRREFLNMQRDLWPVHLFGAKTGFTFALLSAPIVAVIVGAIQLVSSRFAESFPAPILVLVVDWIVVQGTFVRIMGDFFDRYARSLASKHFDLLARAA